MPLTPKQISAGSSALWAGLSAFEDYSAAQDIEAIGDYNARLEEAQTEEEVRRKTLDNRRQEALARARAAASGASGVTSDIYITSMEKSGQEEIDWLKQVGASRYDQALAEARSAKNKAMSSFWGDIGTMGANILSLI